MRRTAAIFAILAVQQAVKSAALALFAAFITANGGGTPHLRGRVAIGLILVVALFAYQALEAAQLYGSWAILPPAAASYLAFSLLPGPVPPLSAGAAAACIAAASTALALTSYTAPYRREITAERPS